MDPAIGELLSLDGRTALVTGGATGIGEAIARTFARAGAQVVIGDIDVEGAQRVADDIGARAVHLDVTDADEAAAVIGSIDESGGLDVLVNNAGTYFHVGSILDQTHESWRKAIDVNLVGVFNCCKPAATSMVASGKRGTIVNIASVDGVLPCMGTGYDSAKAAVIHLSASLAVDLAPHGIRVNCVSPGVIQVPTLEKMRSGEIGPLWPAEPSLSGLMGPIARLRSANVPLGRHGTGEDIARAVLFLATEASSYVTGANLLVDGGWTRV